MGGRDFEIVGRHDEIGRLSRALGDALAGRPGVVLVTGPPGIGKTALWRHVLRDDASAGRDGPRPVVVVATGDEPEADVAYGVIDQLVRRAPLDAAGRARLVPRPGSDAVSVGAELLGVVDSLGPAPAVVVVVDDAQWADEASLRALTFAARRLHDDAVLLCLTCRPEGVDHLPAGLLRLVEGGGTRIDLGPLDAGAVAELAERAYGRPVSRPTADRLVAHSGGNPLHVRALLDEVPFEAAASTGALPVPRSYATLVLAQVAGCAAPAPDLVAALAVLGTPVPLADLARVAGCDDPMGALDDLVARGLVEEVPAAAGPVVAFPHGLVRAAVLGDLPASRRASLHAAAATVTDGDDALAHRLAAAIGPDPDLVAAARARAVEHVRAGAPAAAARQLLAAAPRAASPGERARLVLLAATERALSGALVGDLAAEIAGLPASAPRSFVLGREALGAGDLARAQALLEDAWELATTGEADRRSAVADGDGDGDGSDGDGDGSDDGGDDELSPANLHRRIAGFTADALSILALDRRDGEEVEAWARRALAVGSRSGVSATLVAHGSAIDGRFGDAVDTMSALLADGPSPGLAREAHLGRGTVRLWSNDLEGASSDLTAAVEGGAISYQARMDVWSFRAEIAYREGRWLEALDTAEEIAAVGDDAGDPLFVALPHAVAAFVLAGMGRVDEAQAHLDVAVTSAELTGLLPPRLWAAHATLRLAAARGDVAGVAAVGDALVDEGLATLPEGVHHWRATYVEALVALDRQADAMRVSAELGQIAAASGDVSVAADAARAAGVVAAAAGRRDEAADAFARGLALDPHESRPFERAQLELAAGAHLRRSGNRRDAAALLTDAAARLDDLGAAPWSARCARELDACGLRPRARTAETPAWGDGALTARERLVARLVAGGRTNREVAAELVISAKTVEHHLSRVFAKLGLRSRTELAAHLAAAGADGREAVPVGP